MRCAMTRVLPEPAPAKISSGPSPASTASRCCGLSCERKSVMKMFQATFKHRSCGVRSPTVRRARAQVLLRDKDTIMTTHIGTSGWNYKHWLGPFYPEKFPAKNSRAFYAATLEPLYIKATH